jgi:hypothetical protein
VVKFYILPADKTAPWAKKRNPGCLGYSNKEKKTLAATGDASGHRFEAHNTLKLNSNA